MGITHESLHYLIGFTAQGDMILLADQFAASGIQLQVGKNQPVRDIVRPSPKQRPHPRPELASGKGLGQIIVCTGIQPGHPVLERPLCREEQHRRIVLCLPQLPYHTQAVHPGHHHVQNDQIHVLAVHDLQRFHAGAGRNGLVAVARKDRLHQAARVLVVLDNQNLKHTVTSFLFPSMIQQKYEPNVNK